MKKYAFLFLLLAFAVSPIFGQNGKTVPNRSLSNIPVAPVTEIPAKDWDDLTKALNKEDWTLATTLSSLALSKLEAENDKKQLAQLRYLYIYATAGKVASGTLSYDEFEKILADFTGTEFIFPARIILADCAGKINYICADNVNNQVLRVTAADKAANIHSFEYVKLAEKFDVPSNAGKEASLTGVLEKTETYLGKSDLKIVRLIFNNGSVAVISK